MKNGNPSRPVRSGQTAPHRGLARRIGRQRQSNYRRPVADHDRLAFERVREVWANRGCPPLVIDAGCGTGVSTLGLAERHADALVVGVDKSAARLSRTRESVDNVLLVRANLIDFWRLASAERWQFAAHYLLYPNPWPKSVHLGRRWHAHPVFPSVLSLGGILEMRTNWPVYAEEFASALGLYGYPSAHAEPYLATSPLTPFEAKYARSGHSLFRVRIDLRA